MSIYEIWVPGERGYKEHIDRRGISHDQIKAGIEQTLEYKNALGSLGRNLSNDFSRIVATNEQIISSLDNGLNNLAQVSEEGFKYLSEVNERGFNYLSEVNEKGFKNLAEINERGFNRVTSAIEALHSDLNYFFGTLIQRLEYQNTLLEGILSTIQAPFETMVKEYYRRGCMLAQGGILPEAIDCFKHTIEKMELGKHFFPSYYQLGRLYLSGIDDGVNIINPQTATFYLLDANKYGNDILRTNSGFKPVLADCKFYLSQSYYFQLKGLNNDTEKELINNAIRYCEESVSLNDNLSQGYYHLAKYYSYRLNNFNEYKKNEEIERLKSNFRNAVTIDRNYLRALISNDPFYDKVFEPNKEHLLALINQMISEKRLNAKNKLDKVKNLISQMENKNVSRHENIYNDFLKSKKQLLLADKDFQTDTYYGFDDCLIKLDVI